MDITTIEQKIKDPDGYFDTGEHAFKKRGFKEYTDWLFRDASDRWYSEKPEAMSEKDSMMWSLRHEHKLDYYSPGSDKVIQFFDWDLMNGLFGGINQFFDENVHILDLGSGHGKAIQEINETYKKEGIVCDGVDFRYGRKDYPVGSRNLTAGYFGNLPFKDNSFDRLLSMESFPSWLPHDGANNIDPSKIEQYVKEIARVAKEGALWRGTLTENTLYHVKEYFLKCGWEFYIDTANNYFAAKLFKKNDNYEANRG